MRIGFVEFTSVLQLKAEALFGVGTSRWSLTGKEGALKARGLAAKGVVESLPVEVKALENFIQMIAAELFK